MDENLLVNGAFAGPYRDYQGMPGMAVAPGWVPWWVSQTPQTESWRHRRPTYSATQDRVRAGRTGQTYTTPWGTHVAGLYQQVHVTPGSRVQFSCYGCAWSSEGDDTQTSQNPGNVRLRVGIDPAGGADPLAGSVVWSQAQAVYDRLGHFAVEVVARAPLITVYLYSTVEWPKRHNAVFWDDAHLINCAAAKNAPAGDITAEAEPQVNDAAQPAGKPALLIEAAGRLANSTIKVRASTPASLEGVSLNVYGPYGEVQADWFGVEPYQDGQIWFWTFVPRKAGHYLARLKAKGIEPVESGVYIFEALDLPPPSPERQRGAPRAAYERTYILLPQASERTWMQAVVASGALDGGRYTLGFSADDAGIGDLDKRRVLVVNPAQWEEPVEWWFAKHYPGVKIRTLKADTPEALKTALATGMGQDEWD
jgi:hypothetical protein